MGIEWLFTRMIDEEFELLHYDCEGSAALTIIGDREVHFSEEFNMNIIRHEVRHAFLSELCISDANLNVDQFEEVNCSLDQNRWDDMDKLSRRVFKELK